MYADNVVILSESAAGLQIKLRKLEAYCTDWCLDVNIGKTKIIIFNKAGRLIKSAFTFQNETTECVKSYQYLGLYFSASGSFSYAKSELDNIGLKVYFKFCKNILNLHPSIRTSLYVCGHTVNQFFCMVVKYGELLILQVLNLEMEFRLSKFLIMWNLKNFI